MSLLLVGRLLVIAVASVAAKDSSRNLKHARRAAAAASARKKLTYQRRNQDADTDVIFGISPKDFDKILGSDVAYEFGIYELGIERGEELWNEYADFELDRAMTAEADFVAGEEGVTIADVEFPYLLCSKKKGKSGLQRKDHISDVVRYSLEGEELTAEETALTTASTIFSIYNSEEMSCFGARMPASIALIFAALQDEELPIIPIFSYMKIRAGLVQEILHRADPEYQANVTADESVNSDQAVSSSQNRLETTLCAGMSEEEQQNIGEKIMTFMTTKSTNNDGVETSLVSLSNKYADVTPEEYDFLPSRVKFWLDVYRLGIDSEEGCDEMLENLNFEVLQLNSTGEAVGFYITLNPATDPDDMDSTTTVACALSLIAGIALLPQVCSVELNALVSVSNQEAQWILQDDALQDRPFWDAGITGKGQVIGVSDSGLDTDNCYFWDSSGDIAKDGSTDTSRRKVVQYDPFVDDKDDAGGHGTHVCGTIVGHKAEDGRTESTGFADGVARDAKVAFFDAGGGGNSLSIPGDKSRFLGVGASAGAKLHSSSWGSVLLPYKYDTMSRDIDQYIFEDWNFLLLVAAGNEGSLNNDRTILSPAVGKNVLTVGASQSTTNRGIEYLADFSSRGPTSDDRIKPDVVAPGQSILSAYADPSMVGECDPAVRVDNDGITYMQGTSMATPATSGAAALVRQYFLNSYFPSKESIDPSGMLLKAVLINGAQEISYIDNGITRTPTSYYDNNQGFGRVSLIDSLPLQGSNRFNASLIDKGVIKDGETIPIQMNISKAGGCTLTQMRTTLVWADPPGASGCTKCLVNDLDLSVTKNNNPTVYYPNGRSSKDDRNNVERIIVDAEDGDEIFIEIRAANLDRPEQVFALVITGCVEAKDYVGEAEPQGHSNPNRNIIIIVCSVVGGIILIGVGWCLCTRGTGNGK